MSLAVALNKRIDSDLTETLSINLHTTDKILTMAWELLLVVGMKFFVSHGDPLAKNSQTFKSVKEFKIFMNILSIKNY